MRHTPDVGKIEENLNVLINRWAYVKDGPVTQETLHAIENLRVHIRKGCLSDIPPGCGTERNEYIHRILNRSLLVGSTSISVELALAILTIIFFHMNTKKRYKRVFGDAHLQLGVPVEWVTASEKLDSHCEVNMEPIKRVQGGSECLQSSTSLECGANNVAPQSEGGLLLVCDNVEEMLQVEVANILITQCFNTFQILQNINSKSSSRSFDAFDLPYVIDPQSQDYSFGKVLGSVCSDLSPPSDVIEAHRKQLKRNLAAFDLQIEEVVGDGDCAFTSIIKQLHKAVPNLTKEADNFIRSLGLLKSEEQDTLVLRQMFVDRMLEPDEKLREFIRNGDSDILRRNIEAFRCPGFFNNEVGDFVMKAASSILRIPIVIISSNESAYCIPFVPPDPVMKVPLYVAFTSYGPGHYDSTDLVESAAGTFSK